MCYDARMTDAYRMGFVYECRRRGVSWRSAEALLKRAQAYEPPWTIDRIRKELGDEIADRLANDPVHKWRSDTGIELVHREPTKRELKRIITNWRLMPDEQKRISDEKSMELFGVTNEENAERLLASRHPDFDRIVQAYKDRYGVDLSHMRMKWSKHPVYNDGRRSYDFADDETGGSWVDDGTIRINPNMGAVKRRWGLGGTTAELRRTIMAHELAHEVYRKGKARVLVKKMLANAKKENFSTPYLETVPDRKKDEETFAEYMAAQLNKKAQADTASDFDFPGIDLEKMKAEHEARLKAAKDMEKTLKFGDRVRVVDNIRCRQKGKSGILIGVPKGRDEKTGHGDRLYYIKFDDPEFGVMGFTSYYFTKE